MGRNRLILDTDGGVDDAQALLLLIAAGRPPDAITTVFGNVGLEDATRNVLATLAVAGSLTPVHAGAGSPLACERIDARHVHGEDGLGGAPRPAPLAEAASCDGVDFLVSTLARAAADHAPVDLLMIGPLTNLALALQREPAIVQGVGQMTIMGGTLYGRGNVTPAAEFNIFADPEAADAVLGSGIPITMIPWEPCMSHALAGADIDRLFAPVPDGAYRTFAQALVDHERGRHISSGRGDCLYFIDALAACVAIEPKIVTRSTRAALAVSLAPGVTRGMTIVDPSGRLGPCRVTLVEEVRRDRLAALLAASLAYVPSRRPSPDALALARNELGG
ncbi:MAG: nucleoside hydrolase [Pseudomonadota bacterium]